tara:strand:- start:995 stop:1636 length:642 start_codon:yes stop_codon:yes gene_type:complete
MIVTGSNSDRKKFEVAPAGTHLARLYRIIDLGTQMREYEGKVNMLRKAKFFWELHGEDGTGKPLLTSEGKPLIQSKEYTMSLGEKANLRRDLEAWRGKAFSDEELLGFNLSTVLGHFCMVNISHRDKGDMTYADLKGVSAVPSIYKKQGLPDGVNTTLMFSIDKFDQQVFDSLSESIKDTIRKSPEYRSLEQPTTSAQYAAASVADLDDDLPF